MHFMRSRLPSARPHIHATVLVPAGERALGADPSSSVDGVALNHLALGLSSDDRV
jgi:hypothetical protein